MEAKQCMFMPAGVDNGWYPGFVVGDFVVCACCGQVYDRNGLRHLYLYDEWLNLVDAVMDKNLLPEGLAWDEDDYIKII